jgi:hypothetical protein
VVDQLLAVVEVLDAVRSTGSLGLVAEHDCLFDLMSQTEAHGQSMTCSPLLTLVLAAPFQCQREKVDQESECPGSRLPIAVGEVTFRRLIPSQVLVTEEQLEAAGQDEHQVRSHEVSANRWMEQVEVVLCPLMGENL